MADAGVAVGSGAGGTSALRLADWRLLLGAARFERVALACSAPLADGAAAVADRTEGLGGAAGVDLAVLSSPAAGALRAAFQAIRPGGACLVEWRRPVPGGIGRRLRRLADAGFWAAECYWALPAAAEDGPALWLPLHLPGAEGHLRRSARLPLPPRSRVATAARRRAWVAARRTGALAPLYALAWKPPGGRPPSLAHQVAARWPAWGLGPVPSGLAVVLLAGGRSPLNKVVALPVPHGDGPPPVALKFGRSPASAAALAGEAAALRAVASTALTDAFVVPEVAFEDELAGLPVLGQTPVSGTPLSRLLPARQRELALAVATALRRPLVAARPVPRGGWWDRIVEAALARFAARFGPAVAGPVAGRLRHELGAFAALPLVPEHRDCSPWNVLLTAGGRLALLDWESSEPSGLPVLDLAYYLAHAGFLAEGALGSGREASSYARMLDPATPSGRLFDEAMRRYAAGTALDPAAIGPLRRLAWIVHASVEHDRLVGSPTASERAGGSGLFVRLTAVESGAGR